MFIRLPDNTLIAPPSNVVADNGTDSNIATVKENEKIIITDSQNGALNVPIDLSDAREYGFFFEDSVEEYALLVVGEAKAVNQVISTLLQILPWIIVSIVCISLLAAFFYSNYIKSFPICRTISYYIEAYTLINRSFEFHFMKTV